MQTLRIVLTLILSVITSFSFGNDIHTIFNLGDFELESGAILPSTKLSYITHGKLNEEKDNLILVPSAYLGDHHGYDYLIQANKALDPDKYFIVATDMFQNGIVLRYLFFCQFYLTQNEKGTKDNYEYYGVYFHLMCGNGLYMKSRRFRSTKLSVKHKV